MEQSHPGSPASVFLAPTEHDRVIVNVVAVYESRSCSHVPLRFRSYLLLMQTC
jgi:hypothetical protein